MEATKRDHLDITMAHHWVSPEAFGIGVYALVRNVDPEPLFWEDVESDAYAIIGREAKRQLEAVKYRLICDTPLDRIVRALHIIRTHRSNLSHINNKKWQTWMSTTIRTMMAVHELYQAAIKAAETPYALSRYRSLADSIKNDYASILDSWPGYRALTTFDVASWSSFLLNGRLDAPRIEHWAAPHTSACAR